MLFGQPPTIQVPFRHIDWGGVPLSTIDRQRVAAVWKLEGLGYNFAAGDWMAPANDAAPAAPSLNGDALHTLFVRRADGLAGCTEGSAEEGELAAITDAKAYEAVRCLVAGRRWQRLTRSTRCRGFKDARGIGANPTPDATHC